MRPDAAKELDKLVKIFKDNPTIWIELGSHTDSRCNDEYNQQLSQRRASSAVQYIIDCGIDKNRISAMGYGESQLLNECSNGVKCSPADHQLNRRTEFKIVKQ
ncbi:OmpA family protein [Pedobacter lithocola]|uniref:OmpA family protein n=1 Tax=Pedobacter lithocola TaxID=1908239 RepID=A0ABV8PEU9_9SPHI